MTTKKPHSIVPWLVAVTFLLAIVVLSCIGSGRRPDASNTMGTNYCGTNISNF